MKKVLHKRTPPPDDDCCGSLPCELDLIVTCTRTAAKHVGCNGIYIYIYIYISIRWEDLNVTKTEHATKFIKTGFVLGLLAVSFYVIKALHKDNTMFSAFAISFSNAMFPTLAKILSQFEKHAHEERREVQRMALHQDCHFPLCEYGGNHLDYHTSYIYYYING